MNTLRKIQLGIMAFATLSTIAHATETQSLNAKETNIAPKMKMTTVIPSEITTPDVIESRLGTLHFKNGMPDQDTIKKMYDNIDSSRAVEVYLNMLPAISMWSIRKGQRDSGEKDNTITIMETLMDSTGMYLTPNTETPQTWVSLDLSKGPMVLETPPNVIGVVDDMLFHYVTDFGMLGPDKNKGGKFLFLPPGYKGEIPKGILFSNLLLLVFGHHGEILPSMEIFSLLLKILKSMQEFIL